MEEVKHHFVRHAPHLRLLHVPDKAFHFNIREPWFMESLWLYYPYDRILDLTLQLQERGFSLNSDMNASCFSQNT